MKNVEHGQVEQELTAEQKEKLDSFEKYKKLTADIFETSTEAWDQWVSEFKSEHADFVEKVAKKGNFYLKDLHNYSEENGGKPVNIGEKMQLLLSLHERLEAEKREIMGQ